jgi:hypothetical protein
MISPRLPNRRLLRASVALLAFLIVGCQGDSPSSPIEKTVLDLTIEGAPIDLNILDRSTLEDTYTPLETTAVLYYMVLLLRDSGVIDSATAHSMLLPVNQAHGWLVNGDEAKALVSFANFVQVVQALGDSGDFPPSISDSLVGLANDSVDQLVPSALSIVFTKESTGVPGGMGIFTMRSDGSDVTLLTPLQGVQDQSPLFSPDGSRIAFVRRNSDKYLLYTIRPNGTDLRLVRFATVQIGWPTWSPDGQKIAFQVNGPSNSHIFVVDVDGPGLTQITYGDHEYQQPSWSPDGSRIALYDYQTASIVLVNPNGTGMTSLGFGLPGASWSPDGTRILFRRNNTDPELWTAKPDGSELTRLTSDGMSKSNPHWSPIGDLIAFTSHVQNGPKVFTLRLPDMKLDTLSQIDSELFERAGNWSVIHE